MDEAFQALARRMANLMDAGELPNPGPDSPTIILLEDLATHEDTFKAGQKVWAPREVAHTLVDEGRALFDASDAR